MNIYKLATFIKLTEIFSSLKTFICGLDNVFILHKQLIIFKLHFLIKSLHCQSLK